jgi:hypothetical protein
MTSKVGCTGSAAASVLLGYLLFVSLSSALTSLSLPWCEEAHTTQTSQVQTLAGRPSLRSP